MNMYGKGLLSHPALVRRERFGQRFLTRHRSVLGMVTSPHVCAQLRMGLLSCLFSCWHIPRAKQRRARLRSWGWFWKGLFHVPLRWAELGQQPCNRKQHQTTSYCSRATKAPAPLSPIRQSWTGDFSSLWASTHTKQWCSLLSCLFQESMSMQEDSNKLPKTLPIRNIFLETLGNFKVYWGKKPRNIKQVIELQWKAMAW